MKMKMIKTTMLAVALGFAVTGQADTYQINTKSSQLEWTGAKVIGDKHVGSLGLKKGEVVYTGKNPSSAVIVVDMTSLANKDLTDPKWNAKLVGHLKSDDFFSVEKFKEAKLEINKFEKQGKADYKLTGNLTIKGITKPVTLKATTVSAQKITANLEFDRTEFNVRYGSGKFFDNLGDKMISDKVQVKVDLELNKPIQLGQK
jgi:polyisoprenoid-binding protein YceI